MQTSSKKRFSNVLQFRGLHLWKVARQSGSTFENLISGSSRGTVRVVFDATHRFVFSYYWSCQSEYEGFKVKRSTAGRLSGITSFQERVSIRITEQMTSSCSRVSDFETPGQPKMVAPFKKTGSGGPGNLGFDPNSFNGNSCDTTIREIARQSRRRALAQLKRTADGLLRSRINNGSLDSARHAAERAIQTRVRESCSTLSITRSSSTGRNTTDGSDFGRVKKGARSKVGPVRPEVVLLAREAEGKSFRRRPDPVGALPRV